MNKYVLRNVYKKPDILPRQLSILVNNTFTTLKQQLPQQTLPLYQLYINTFKMTDAQVAGGHKAAINNPNVPEETKEHSREVLEKEFNGGDVTKADDNQEKNPNNVAGGLKATLNNPNVSDEAKKNAQERLDKEDF
ncbi:hypothetical protein LB507_007257 [Fusarium sp. FIESC RH6]|nr:hypothetical protein LB507_007257 [Fusarium sp. FIESC RH6]